MEIQRKINYVLYLFQNYFIRGFYIEGFILNKKNIKIKIYFRIYFSKKYPEKIIMEYKNEIVIGCNFYSTICEAINALTRRKEYIKMYGNPIEHQLSLLVIDFLNNYHHEHDDII